MLTDRTASADARADSVAAGDRGRAPPPDPQRPARQLLHHRGQLRTPRGAPRRLPHRLRRERPCTCAACYEAVESLADEGYLEPISLEKAMAQHPARLRPRHAEGDDRRWASPAWTAIINAQIFEAVGLSQELVDRFFTGTVTPRGRHDIWTIWSARSCAATRKRWNRRSTSCPPAAGSSRSATARTTSTIPKRSTCCRRRCARATMRCIRNMSKLIEGDAPGFAAQPAGLSKLPPDPAGRGGAGGAHRAPLQDRRDELRLHQPGGARVPRAWR